MQRIKPNELAGGLRPAQGSFSLSLSLLSGVGSSLCYGSVVLNAEPRGGPRSLARKSMETRFCPRRPARKSTDVTTDMCETGQCGAKLSDIAAVTSRLAHGGELPNIEGVAPPGWNNA